MATVINPISPYEYIGNSLATINTNFANLQTSTDSISSCVVTGFLDIGNIRREIGRRIHTNELTGNNVTAGVLTVTGDSTFIGSVWISGSYTAMDTLVTVTSALSVTNLGTGPALFVRQNGNEAIAAFYDEVNPALYVDGRTSYPGYVGVGTSTPLERLTVTGNISSSNALSADYIIAGVYNYNTNCKPLPNTRGAFYSNVASYSQINHQNFNTAGTSDFIATADNGTDTTNYINFGINGSAYSGDTIVGVDDGYLYATGNLAVGTCNNKDIRFNTGGNNSTNERLRITGGGDICANTGTCAATNVYVNTGSGASTADVAIQTGSSTGNLTLGSTSTTISKLVGATACIGGTTSCIAATTNCIVGTVYINNSGSAATNIGTSTGNVTIGNATGSLSLNGNGGTITTASTLNINTGTSRDTNINTAAGSATTTIGNNGTVALCGTVTAPGTAPSNGSTTVVNAGNVYTALGATSLATATSFGTTNGNVTLGKTGTTTAINGTVTIEGFVNAAGVGVCIANSVNFGGSASGTVCIGVAGQTTSLCGNVNVPTCITVPAGSIANGNTCAIRGGDIYSAFGNVSTLAAATGLGTSAGGAVSIGVSTQTTRIDGSAVTIGRAAGTNLCILTGNAGSAAALAGNVCKIPININGVLTNLIVQA